MNAPKSAQLRIDLSAKRQTSVDVYRQIRDEGLLSKQRWRVFEVLHTHGPMTATEAWKVLGGSRVTVSPRFKELEVRGVIRVNRIRPCTVTGRSVIEWAITGELPTEPKKRKTEAQILRGWIDQTLEFLQHHADGPHGCNDSACSLCHAAKLLTGNRVPDEVAGSE
jgi:predicted transcriptional regulator